MSEDLKIEQLLAREKAAILAGRIQDIADLTEQKRAFLRAIESDRPRRSTVVRLRKLASENAALLTASGNGLKAAIEQIRAAKAPGQLQTYDNSGQRTVVGAPHSGLEQKL